MREPGASPAATWHPLSSDDRMTLVKVLIERARTGPGRPAMRELEKGIWQEYTRGAVLGHVPALALGLHALGLRREEKVAIISDNRPEAYWMMSAAQAVGAVPVPVYQDAIAKEIQYVIDNSDARFVLAEDQEQVDKLLEVRAGRWHSPLCTPRRCWSTWA